MNSFRADLHCHTTCSDGSLTPTQIVQLAGSIGLQGLSITDHDSIYAYPEAMVEAASLGISLLPGIEFSAMHGPMSVHILAYAFSLDNPIIKQFCERHHLRRQQRCLKILDLLAQKQVPLMVDEQLAAALKNGHAVGRPHVAAAMVRQGLVNSIETAFRQFLGEGCPCYVSVTPISVEETLAVIHSAKGLAVLAHPHLISNEALLKALLEMPFDGIETFYARFPESRHKRWIEIATKKGWLMTGGSDFHGEMKPQIQLGCSWVSQETFHALTTHLQGAS